MNGGKGHHVGDADARGVTCISNVHFATGIYAYNIPTTRWYSEANAIELDS